MERAVNKTVVFSVSLMERVDEVVKEYNFKNSSDLIRSCVYYFFDFLELKEKLKDPEVNRKFIEEHDPLIQNEKDMIRLDQVVSELTTEEINRIQFALAKESNKRVGIINKSLKMNREVMQRGGEINPKVGYHESYHDDDTVFYVPITPEYPKWKELSLLEKETLRDELKIKLEAYPQRYPNEQHQPSLSYVLKEITEAIEREKK
jgi:hypothetical protein